MDPLLISRGLRLAHRVSSSVTTASFSKLAIPHFIRSRSGRNNKLLSARNNVRQPTSAESSVVPSGGITMEEEFMRLQDKLTKQTLNHPRPPLAKHAFSATFNREPVIMEIYEEFHNRHIARENLKAKGPIPQDTRLENPIIAITSPPGKSHLLDLVYHKLHLENCKHTQLRDTIGDSQPLMISFSKQVPNGSNILARALLSSCFNIEGWGLMDPAFNLVTVHGAYKLICSIFKKKGILLVVDEIMKLEEPQARQVLSDLGHLLDSYDNFNCVVSTLDLLYFLKVASESGRPFKFIQLPPPTLTEALHLFGMTIADQRSPIGQCICECNAHLRTMEILKRVWDALSQTNTAPTVAELLEQLLKETHHLTNRLNEDIITAALLQVELSWDSEINGALVNNLIADGTLLNYESCAARFIPRITPFNLRRWLHYSALKSSKLAAYLRAIFKVLDDLASSGKTLQTQGGSGFELFQLHWEALYRFLYQGKTVQLAEYFNGATFFPPSLGQVKVLVTAAEVQESKQKFYTLNTNNLDAKGTVTTTANSTVKPYAKGKQKSTNPDAKGTIKPAENIVHYASNNGVFEFSSCLQSASAPKWYTLLYQCKYTALNATGAQPTVSQINTKKITDTCASLESLLARKDNSMDPLKIIELTLHTELSQYSKAFKNNVIVFCSLRPLGSLESLEERKGKTSLIILPPAATSARFSPTFDLYAKYFQFAMA